MNSRLYSLKQVLERIPLSKTEIYRRIKRGEFPQPVRIGANRIAFLDEQIEEWIRCCIATRENMNQPKEHKD